MPTKAELKQRATHIKLKVRKGDRVVIISGKDKGEIGFVAAVSPKDQKVIVLKDNEENPEQPFPLNAAIKHRKAKTQGERSVRIKIPVPIHVSNVMVLMPQPVSRHVWADASKKASSFDTRRRVARSFPTRSLWSRKRPKV